MININFTCGSISIKSIEENDMDRVGYWLSEKNDFNNEIFHLKEFNDRFLEYYISESEFFLKAEYDNKMIGVLKGRIEFKNENQVWFWYFNVENKKYSSFILRKTIDFFKKEFSINDFYAIVDEKSDLKDFYIRNKFKLSRISKNFFRTENNNLDMFILKLSKVTMG